MHSLLAEVSWGSVLWRRTATGTHCQELLKWKRTEHFISTLLHIFKLLKQD